MPALTPWTAPSHVASEQRTSSGRPSAGNVCKARNPGRNSGHDQNNGKWLARASQRAFFFQVTELKTPSNFASLLGLRFVHREDGLSRVALDVEQRHANTHGIAHGGVLTAVMDTASGLAVAYQPSTGGKGITTVSLSVTYLGATFVGDTITATARRRGRGKRLITLDVQVENQKGELVAIGICTLRVRSGEGKIKPAEG